MLKKLAWHIEVAAAASRAAIDAMQQQQAAIAAQRHWAATAGHWAGIAAGHHAAAEHQAAMEHWWAAMGAGGADAFGGWHAVEEHWAVAEHWAAMGEGVAAADDADAGDGLQEHDYELMLQRTKEALVAKDCPSGRRESDWLCNSTDLNAAVEVYLLMEQAPACRVLLPAARDVLCAHAAASAGINDESATLMLFEAAFGSRWGDCRLRSQMIGSWAKTCGDLEGAWRSRKASARRRKAAAIAAAAAELAAMPAAVAAAPPSPVLSPRAE